MKLEFPKGFYWGSATSSHQVEGNNHNDWTEWEKENAKRLAEEAKKKKWPDYILNRYPNPLQPENYISGKACDHYNRFRDDFDIAKSLGHNAYRFSIEWSRIEPEEGKFDEKEIEHYRQMILALRERGIEPFVTLWHWTNPIWIRDIGGWENKKTISYFLRYVERIMRSPGIGDSVNFWIILNEPTVYTSLGYIKATQPPGIKNTFRARKALSNLVKAHAKAYDLIRSIDQNARVSTAYAINYWLPYQNKLLNKFLSGLMIFLEGNFFKKIKNKIDFIALQYYRSVTIGFKRGGDFLGVIDTKFDTDENVSDLGWKIYPEGLYHFLKKHKVYKLPIYITENGIADARDGKRTEFIREHLRWVHKAINEGVDVRGYFYWSLLDNFEFVEIRGFSQRFGLVEIDYKTMERKVRNSALEYKKIIENSLDVNVAG